MADTVKKSRIVSGEDQDLEEALLEEFNLRLKNCMSHDDLQKDADPPEPDEIYECIPSPTKTSPPKTLPQKTSPKNHILATEAFLQTEIQQDNYYDEPRSLLNNGTRQNGHDDVTSEPHEEEIYENIPEKTENLDQYVQMVENKVEHSQNVDLSPQKSLHEEYEPMGLDDASSNLYESVELKPQSVEPVEHKKLTPTLNLPTTLFTDYSEQKSPDAELKCSAKDRMLLSDETSTLLFTQTVTSPMLTPSEENIDFLKGFQRDNTNSESTVSNSSPPKEMEDKLEATETSPDMSEPLEEEKLLQNDNIYENTEYHKNTTPENMYENLMFNRNAPDEKENIYEHLNNNKSEMQQEGDVGEVENIYQNIEECLGNDGDQISVKNAAKSQDTDDGSLEEFIRNEREVTESFLVNHKASTVVEEDTIEPQVNNEPKVDVELVEQEVCEQDVVDRVQNEVVGLETQEMLLDLGKSSHEYIGSVEERKTFEQEVVETTNRKYEVIDVKEIEDTSEDHQKRVITNGQKIVESVERSQKDRDTTESIQKVSTKESKEKIATETYKELIYHQKLETNSNYCEKYTEVVSKSSKNEIISNREKDTETVPAEIVKNLKSQFQSKAGAEVVGIVKKGGMAKKENSVAEMKSPNIINQIKTRFEAGTEGGDGKKNEESTEYHTETIVETSGPMEKCIKKKKVKKTRKEEKENISVTQNGTIEGESFYNVNVKNLCRSFGDLTKIDKERNNKKNIDRTRTKSLTDMVYHSNLKTIENVFSGVSVRTLKSSFSKFDALQKKNVLHVRSSDSTKAQEKFSNGTQIELSTNCKTCGKQVFQMEQIKAEKAVWHKNCFRCTACSKQLTVDTYESNDGSLYCKAHFKALFAPKAVEDDGPPKPRRHEPIIRENQPVELPPGVARASDKPDLGLEELQSLNVKERFQVFEHYQNQQTESSEIERGGQNVKRSPSILSKLARFQKHGMDVGVSNEALDGIPIEESSSEEEVEEEVPEGEDPDLVRAKRVQKEKPFHFTGMVDVKKRWEQGDHAREERREETKQEIQNIRTRLFMGKQEKMKEAYQNAIMESESSTNLRNKNNSEKIEVCDTKSIKDRWERGQVSNERVNREISKDEEEEVYESEISKKSRSLFLELDANSSKPPQVSPASPPKLEVKKAREAYLDKTSKEDTVKSTEQMEEIEVRTADIQERFKFFETYKEPEKNRKQFRITPPRDPSQVKTETPEREIYRDPEVVRSEEYIDDSKIAKETHTASKMLNKFREMEENLAREPEPQGLKPLKCFTPPPEPTRPESRSEEESSEYEEEEEEEVEQHGKLPDDLIEAQKAARAKQLRAKFEKWEVNEIKREQQNAINIVEETGEEQSQIESTRVLRARFEQMRDSTTTESNKSQKIKPNRFVEMSAAITETCQSCNGKVYPLEKISIHGNVYHKSCFKCMECSCVLRMDSYSYNQGLLYCTPHFKRLFISKGNYDSAFGLDQHKEKWQNSVNNMTVA